MDLRLIQGSLGLRAEKIESDSDGFVKGAALYTELRPGSDGTHVKTAQTTAENLKALDTAVDSKADRADSLAGYGMGNGENMINAGISIALDKGFTNSKAVMARTIKAQGEALEEQRKANAEQEVKIHNLEAENAAIKEQNARLEARLAAIEAKLGK